MGKKRPKQTPHRQVDAIYVNPLFKVVFITLTIILCVLLALAVYLAAMPQPTELQKQLFTFSFNGCELILGAIVGLIGGKSIDAFAFRKPE